MPEYLHEVVARREGVIATQPWRDSGHTPPITARNDIFNDTIREMSIAYERQLAYSIALQRQERREQAIRHAIASGSDSVTLVHLPMDATQYGHDDRETIHITQEMRDRYGNV